MDGFARVREIAERFPDVWCSVGIHPHEAEKELLDAPDVLIQATRHPKVVGIGETGLDYYYEHSPRTQQVANFRTHIAAARQTGLPLIVHTRDAEDETIAILGEEMAKGRFTGLIHCFTGTKRLAEAAIDLGLYISASGIATFKKSDELRAVLKDVPLTRLLVETDSPYLAPMPMRGKRNEPAFVRHTAAALASLRGINERELEDATTENFLRLFTKVIPPT
jgi:TatD DNase family protein